MEKECHSISTTISRTLSNEADLMRMISFPSDYKVTSIDDFDKRSYHISITINNELTAYARLTPGPDAVLHKWTQGKSRLPNDTYTADLGRWMVSHKYRGFDFFNMIVIEGCINAFMLGFKMINITYMPEHRHIKDYVHQIGFVDCGVPLVQLEPGGVLVPVQPASCRVTDELYQQWILKRHDGYKACLAKLVITKQ